MKKYVKNYFKANGYVEGDIILCEVCNSMACEIHHITFKSQCGSDEADNLIALCRNCHNKAHDNELSKEYFFKIKKK